MRQILTAFAFMTMSAFAQTPAAASPLEPYLWQKRLMIIFAPSLGDHRLIDQRELNVHAIDGLQARDMVVFAVIGDDHVNPELNRAPAEGAADIRRRFGIARDRFAVVLVGKDGTEKYRSGQPVDLSFIFDIVDGMPMRRREMRERKT
jgi:hypothetical protein